MPRLYCFAGRMAARARPLHRHLRPDTDIGRRTARLHELNMDVREAGLSEILLDLAHITAILICQHHFNPSR
jgi:hypothetical protein